MPNFEQEIYSTLYTTLNNNIVVDGDTIPFFSDKLGNVSKYVAIQSYQEQDEDVKDRFGARCTVTLVCVSNNDGVDTTNGIANAVKNLIKASVSSTITSPNIDIVLTRSPRVARYSDNDNGNIQHRVELSYEMLVYSIS